MNIKEELLREHSKKNALSIANYALTSAANFKKLMECFTCDEKLVPQRAAWSVCWAALQKSAIILPHVKALVAQLERKDVHPAVVRNALRVLQTIEVPEAFHGDLMAACFRLVETPSSPVAVKVFALENLLNLSRHYPEILAEIRLIVEDNWDNETPAFRAKGRKILKLKK